MKRWGVEECLNEGTWLDKRWQEKDKMLGYYQKHGVLPGAGEGRGWGRERRFYTRTHQVEASVLSCVRLLGALASVPLICILSVPGEMTGGAKRDYRKSEATTQCSIAQYLTIYCSSLRFSPCSSLCFSPRSSLFAVCWCTFWAWIIYKYVIEGTVWGDAIVNGVVGGEGEGAEGGVGGRR